MLTELASTEAEVEVHRQIGPIFSVELEKDADGRIGIGIGGGAGAHCPQLYVCQLFEGSPATRNQVIEVGDEILAFNGESVRGMDKAAVAAKIRVAQSPVRITIKKLHVIEAFDVAGEQQLLDLDILLKSFKHRLVDAIDDDGLADSLGLSRAVLVNDQLKRAQDRLKEGEQFYRELLARLQPLREALRRQINLFEEIASSLCEASSLPATTTKSATEIFHFGELHRVLATEQQVPLKNSLDKLIGGLEVHLSRVLPDTRQTLRRYQDTKYRYLAFCLKAREMEDEETAVVGAGEHLPRMEDGNIEYRLVLKSREESRRRFLEMRDQTLVKLELMAESRGRELGILLEAFFDALKAAQSADHLKGEKNGKPNGEETVTE